jgi:PAS domain S-box-containing protein
MKKINYLFWYFPPCFFLFLAIFISIKFIFIFFFRTAYEPEIMFDLTPYYILSGVNNLDLLLLSLIVVWFDVFFHININKRNLLFSFLPTGIMLAGLGLKIATVEIVFSNFFHYLVFGCLLVIVLIDHKHILMLPDIVIIPRKELKLIGTKLDKPARSMVEPQVTRVPDIGRSLQTEGIDEILKLHKNTLSDLRTLIKEDIRRAEVTMEELERKAKKIDRLGEEIEERRKNLVQEERMFRQRFISSLEKNNNSKPIKINNGLTTNIDSRDKTKDQHPMLDDFIGSAFIMKRGILKQVNQGFIELLGYDTKDVFLDKSLLNFIAPEGLSGIEGYYLNKLKGAVVSTYETVLLTKNNNKLSVEISIKPIILNGEKAEFAIVKILKKEDKK